MTEVETATDDASNSKKPRLEIITPTHPGVANNALIEDKSPTNLPNDVDGVVGDEIITLDIGGKIFRSYKSTLTKYDSKIKYILEGKLPGYTGEAIFLDVGFKFFEIVLDFMRFDKLFLPSDFQDNKRLRHLAEQIWFFDFLQALERENDGYIPGHMPMRYVEIRVRQEVDELGFGPHGGCVKGSMQTNPDVHGKLRTQRMRQVEMHASDQVKKYLQACQGALEKDNGTRVFVDGNVAPGQLIDFLEIYALPEAPKPPEFREQREKRGHTFPQQVAVGNNFNGATCVGPNAFQFGGGSVLSSNGNMYGAAGIHQQGNDWICLSCKTENWPRRQFCYKCQTPRGQTHQGPVLQQPQQQVQANCNTGALLTVQQGVGSSNNSHQWSQGDYPPPQFNFGGQLQCSGQYAGLPGYGLDTKTAVDASEPAPPGSS